MRRTPRFGGRALAVLTVVGTVLAGPGTAGAYLSRTQADPNWVSGWAAAPSALGRTGLAGHTLRMIVPVGAPGRAIRIRLTNTLGPVPITFDHVTVAVAAGNGGVVPATLRSVAFDGNPRITIAARSQVWSDTVPLDTHTGESLAVSIYSDNPSVTTDVDDSTAVNAFESALGDHTTDPTPAAFSGAGGRTVRWQVLDDIAVAAPRGWVTVVAFGDSITAGYQDHQRAGHPTWPMLLGRRLADSSSWSCRVSVVNEGISGNRLTQNAIAHFGGGPSGQHRFGPDVLSQPGVVEAVVDLGVNDLSWAATHAESGATARVERADRMLVAEARARHVTILPTTLTPGGDPAHPTSFLGGYSTRAGVEARNRVNRWIRTSPLFGAVADFDRAVRSSADRNRLAGADDSGDHLHPDTAGYAAMVRSIPISAIRGCTRSAPKGHRP